MFVASRSSSRWTRVRVASDVVRIVPASRAVSGMTLVVEPARTLATVTTAGSKTSTRRVTNVWNAPTMAQATGTGSLAWWGIDACPPRPVTVTENTSAEAISGPGRVAIMPEGKLGDWWMANARVTGWSSSRPSSIMTWAPPKPSSPGWNMNTTRPERSSARSTSSRAAEASIAVWAS